MTANLADIARPLHNPVSHTTDNTHTFFTRCFGITQAPLTFNGWGPIFYYCSQVPPHTPFPPGGNAHRTYGNVQHQVTGEGRKPRTQRTPWRLVADNPFLSGTLPDSNNKNIFLFYRALLTKNDYICILIILIGIDYSYYYEQED